MVPTSRLKGGCRQDCLPHIAEILGEYTLEIYCCFQLYCTPSRRSSYFSESRTGDVSAGVAPAYEVERVLRIRPEDGADFLSNRYALGERQRLALARESAQPIESPGGVAKLELGGSGKRRSIQVKASRGVEVPRVCSAVRISTDVVGPDVRIT